MDNLEFDGVKVLSTEQLVAGEFAGLLLFSNQLPTLELHVMVSSSILYYKMNKIITNLPIKLISDRMALPRFFASEIT